MNTINKEMNLELVMSSRQTKIFHDGMSGYQDFSIELSKLTKALHERAINKTYLHENHDSGRYTQHEVYVLEYEDFSLHVTEYHYAPYGIEVIRSKNHPEEI